MALALGGTVARTGTAEFGRTPLQVIGNGTLFAGLPLEASVWMSHNDAVSLAPQGFAVTATTTQTPIAAFENSDAGLYGVQFHPEVLHTERGLEVLKHFLYQGAQCRPTWTMVNIVDEQVDRIRAQVGSGRAVCGLSGGVDSAVAAALVQRAIGDRLTCVFVDHGLLRKGEGDQVVETFQRHQGIELIHVQAGDRFFERLEGVTDPEDK